MENVVLKRLLKSYAQLILGVLVLLVLVYFIVSSIVDTADNFSANEPPVGQEEPVPPEGDEPTLGGEFVSPFKEVNEVIAKEKMGEEEGERAVLYTVDFVMNWSSNTHPNWYPRGAHASPVVAWTHVTKDNNGMYALEESASDAVEVMAETGGTDGMEDDLDALKETRVVFDYSIGERIDSPGQYSVLLKAHEGIPYATVVSMIAPSPDWFVSTDAVRLFDNGTWAQHLEIPLVLYDAGTDNGTTFNAFDRNTPQGPDRIITRKSEIGFPLGFVRFTLLSDV